MFKYIQSYIQSVVESKLEEREEARAPWTVLKFYSWLAQSGGLIAAHIRMNKSEKDVRQTKSDILALKKEMAEMSGRMLTVEEYGRQSKQELEECVLDTKEARLKRLAKEHKEKELQEARELVRKYERAKSLLKIEAVPNTEGEEVEVNKVW